MFNNIKKIVVEKIHQVSLRKQIRLLIEQEQNMNEPYPYTETNKLREQICRLSDELYGRDTHWFYYGERSHK